MRGLSTLTHLLSRRLGGDEDRKGVFVKVGISDNRRNLLGQGPKVTGSKNELITWVDIKGKKIRSLHLASGAITEYETAEEDSFATPDASGQNPHSLGSHA